MTVNYHDRGNDYRAQKGVTIKTERYDYEPGKPEKNFAKGPGREEYFECHFDGFGNICDGDGIVVFPSNSGASPLKIGDKVSPDDYWGEK